MDAEDRPDEKHVEVRISITVGNEEFSFFNEGFALGGTDLACAMLNSLKIIAVRALGFPAP